MSRTYVTLFCDDDATPPTAKVMVPAGTGDPHIDSHAFTFRLTTEHGEVTLFATFAQICDLLAQAQNSAEDILRARRVSRISPTEAAR